MEFAANSERKFSDFPVILSSDKTAKKKEFLKSYKMTKNSLKLWVSLWKVEDADLLAIVELFKIPDGENPSEFERLALKQSYFPYVSQYCIGPFVLSFIDKMKEDFFDLGYSNILQTVDLDKMDMSTNEIQSELGLRYSEPFPQETKYKSGDTIASMILNEPQTEIKDCPNPAKENDEENPEKNSIKQETALIRVKFKSKLL